MSARVKRSITARDRMGRLRRSQKSPRPDSARADRHHRGDPIRHGAAHQSRPGRRHAAFNRAFRDYGLFPWDAEAWHTPLAYAVTRGREEVVRLLIERGIITESDRSVTTLPLPSELTEVTAC